jgi:hypothetical protein
VRRSDPDGGERVEFVNAGENPPDGAVLTYVLAEEGDASSQLSVYDADGTLLRRWSGDGEGQKRLPTGRGSHRIIWNLRYPDPEALAGIVYRGGEPRGPLAPPGRYKAVLESKGVVVEAAFAVAKAPGVEASDQDLKEQFEFLIEVRDRLSETHRAIARIRALKEDLGTWKARLERAGEGANANVVADIDEAIGSLSAIEGGLVQVRASSPKDLLNFPLQVNVKIGALLNSTGGADARPTVAARAVFAALCEDLDAKIGALRTLANGPLADLSRRLRALPLEALALTEEKPA